MLFRVFVLEFEVENEDIILKVFFKDVECLDEKFLFDILIFFQLVVEYMVVIVIIKFMVFWIIFVVIFVFLIVLFIGRYYFCLECYVWGLERCSFKFFLMYFLDVIEGVVMIRVC